MRQLTFVRPGLLEWWDVPEPRIEAPIEALVRPVAVATCDLDMPILRGQAPFKGPFAFGHEFVAEVVSVGEGVQQIKPGQLVVVPFQISCGACAACLCGRTGNCVTVSWLSSYGMGNGNWGGAYSDLVRVPFADAMLIAVPEGTDAAAIASASDNIPDAWRTVGPQLQERPEAPILIVGGAGSGSIALYAVAIAKALGASQVDYADRDRNRLEMAQALGAKVIEVGEKFPRRFGLYPITVDSGGDPQGLASVLRSTERDGICTSTGVYFTREVAMPLNEMYSNIITFKTGRVHARTIIPEVLALVSAGRLAPEKVTSEHATWDQAAEALQDFRTKLVVTR